MEVINPYVIERDRVDPAWVHSGFPVSGPMTLGGPKTRRSGLKGERLCLSLAHEDAKNDYICNKDEWLLCSDYDRASMCCQKQYSQHSKWRQVRLFTANGC